MGWGTMVRTTLKIHLIACHIEDFSLDCYVAFLARGPYSISVLGELDKTEVEGDLPSQVARVERGIGSSFGGASWTGILGSNLPSIFAWRLSTGLEVLGSKGRRDVEVIEDRGVWVWGNTSSATGNQQGFLVSDIFELVEC
jgi:hypothetical protein